MALANRVNVQNVLRCKYLHRAVGNCGLWSVAVCSGDAKSIRGKRICGTDQSLEGAKCSEYVGFDRGLSAIVGRGETQYILGMQKGIEHEVTSKCGSFGRAKSICLEVQKILNPNHPEVQKVRII